MKKLIVNGMVLTQEQKVGVPRFVSELLRSLDHSTLPFQVEVVVPVHVEERYHFIRKVILPVHGKRSKATDILWQALILPRYARRMNGVLVQPGLGYGLYGNDVLIIYDLQPEHIPDNYTGQASLYRKEKQKLRTHAIHSARKIITISNYVKADLMQTYHLPPDRITVVPCGWQHFERIQPDEKVYSLYPVLQENRGQYYFSLGSRYAHKNQRWVYAAANNSPEDLFVITGYNDVASYSGAIVQEAPDNVLFTGFLPDGQVKTLMRDCKAFIHPSLSEGFGIPPMEALSVGAPIIVSNSTSLPEIYGKTAHYIDPLNYTDVDLDQLLLEEVEPAEALLKKYSWDRAAEIFAQEVSPLLQVSS